MNMLYNCNLNIENTVNSEIISYKKIEICRLCGEKSLDYISIFEDKDNYIPEKISRCLPIIVS